MSCADPAGFAEALRSGDLRRIAAFPKADRHCHSLLSASLKSIERWAGATIRPAPSRMGSFDEMRQYMHEVLYPHVNSRQGFEFAAEQAIREAIEDGIKVLEMSLDIRFMRCYAPETDGFHGFIQHLAGKLGAGIFRPEIGVSKNRLPSEEIPLAMACIDSGLFRSIDLYGNEEAQPPEAYRDLYRHAARRGLKLKAHVGEFGDAPLVERTIRVLGLREVQHGVSAATSPALIAVLRDEGIRLNLCPTSNVALSVVPSIADHPIGILHREGVRVSVNSDDKTIFGRSVSEEYLALYRSGALSPAELEAVRVDSLID